MTNRLPYDNTNQHSLWNRKKFTAILPMFRRVIVAHAEAPAGESMALLLGFKGFPSIYAQDLCSTRRLLDEWGAQALLLDKRLDIATDFAFVRNVTAAPTHAERFIVALSSIHPEDSMSALQAAGFDGHCRRPCPVWRLTDLLREYFDRAPYP
ncbi:response regulator receiver protein [Caballeronia sp.]|uniref:response regulator receiver protein n=1 Tax=Caballeronia sp. TaxID=1931223 RepID=UPI003C6EFC6E